MAKDHRERVWKMMQSIHLCMLSNWDGKALHARPMGAFVRRDENAIYFLADARRHKDDEMRRYPQVCIAFADTRAQEYVSVSGLAEVSFDRKKVKELWSIPAKIWWDSPDDPNICVLKVVPQSAEYWDAHGTTVAYFKTAMAVATGSHIQDAGEHEKVAM
jgi:general stress protein 26